MIEIDISSTGETMQVTPEAASADVPGMILSRSDDSDTTITISDVQQEGDRQLLVSLSGGRAFVGLILDDQQFQLAREVSQEHDVAMTIGGQATSIANRFVVEPAYAARAATLFVGGDPLGAADLTWIVQ